MSVTLNSKIFFGWEPRPWIIQRVFTSPNCSITLSTKDKNGLHRCLVFELLGVNLGMFCRGLFRLSQLPTTLDKIIARQLISTVDLLNNICGFAHTSTLSRCDFAYTDIKPNNVLISLPKRRYTIDEISKEYPSPGLSEELFSSKEKITIPNSSVKLMRSEPFFPAIKEEDYPHIRIKLVGYCHGAYLGSSPLML